MTFPAAGRSTRVLRLASVCLAWLAMGPGANAATLPASADFDADGRLDTAVVRQTAATPQIEVRLSGSGPSIFLTASAPVVTLRAADVNGDGQADLVADTPRGLRAWVYAGRRMVPAHHATALVAVRSPVFATHVAPRAPDGTSCYDSRPRPLALGASAFLAAGNTSPGTPRHCVASGHSRTPGTLAAPRAPPLA